MDFLSAVGFCAIICTLIYLIHWFCNFMSEFEEIKRKLISLDLDIKDTKLNVDLLERHTKIFGENEKV